MATESEKSNPSILPAQENPVKTLDSTVSEPDLHEHSPNNILTKDCEDPNSTVSSPAGDDGPVSNIQKKTRRAERFGITLQLTEEEKRNSRAERFGLCDASVAPDDESRKKTTADVEGKKKATADEEAKKKARLARFAPVSKTDTVEEEKRKARTIRSIPLQTVAHITIY
ncbi:hypothetical protein F2P56_008520 [Juglans regia]|uniref:THO1-MOS11 C-terminal domain-containing protein n=1 Tax=Juglans regia TaxID=51240 RepID=A0A833XWP0_JUGRE|nr:hypothetical protein F2P56_008520 [Juglans regia]